MKIIQAQIKRAMLPVLLFLFPLTSNAGVGSLGSVAVTALKIFAALWGSATLAIFLLLRRKLSLVKCFGWSMLFLFSPVLLQALAILWGVTVGYALGAIGTDRVEHTRAPLTVYGVVFPLGSRIEYEQTGGFFGWRAERALQHISGPHPVLLGNIYIDGFTYIPNNSGNTIRLRLSAGQTVDGWPCGGDTTVDVGHGAPRLRSCFLAAPHMWRGKLVPAGTSVYVTPDGTECVGSICLDSLP